MSLATVEIIIEGTTPLLCNRFTDEAQQRATSGSSAAGAGDRGTPKEQAEKRLYVGHDGKPMIPQPNLFRSIIDAGTFFKAGKNKVTTQKSSMIPACIEIDGIELPIPMRFPAASTISLTSFTRRRRVARNRRKTGGIKAGWAMLSQVRHGWAMRGAARLCNPRSLVFIRKGDDGFLPSSALRGLVRQCPV